jgi:hypothetical protein
MVYRQSLLEDAACLHRFKAHHIDGVVRPENEFTVRGRDMHAMHAEYVDHLTRYQISSDYAMAEQIAGRSHWSREAVHIFNGWYPGQTFEPETVLGTEINILLTGDGSVTDDRDNAAYSVTIDRLEIDGTRGRVVDGKTHFAVFEPTTIQAALYSWATAKAYPFLEEVEFKLEFWRWGASRSRSFTVAELPSVFAMEVQPWIDRVEDAQANNLWPPMPSWACSVCTIDCPLVASGVSRKAIGQIRSEADAQALTSELYAMTKTAERLQMALKGYVGQNGAVKVGDGIELNFRKRALVKYSPARVLQLNDEFGFRRDRALRVDKAEVKKIAKQYPEYLASLEETAQDNSTTEFGFGITEESEDGGQ